MQKEATTAYKLCLYCRHNDLAWNVRNFVHNQLQRFNFSADLRTVAPWATSSWSHTDLPRMQQGMLGAQVPTVSLFVRNERGMPFSNLLCHILLIYGLYVERNLPSPGPVLAVVQGLAQNRNRIHRFYWNMCFSKIRKSKFVFLVIIINSNKIAIT
jgi:hypothetical protein